MVGLTKGIDIVYMSDILPGHEGSGLGASSSLIVGTLHALHAFKGENVSADTLAKEACEIEIDILGHPIGKQDQYITAFGGFNFIKFNSDESVFVNPIILKKETRQYLNNNLIAFYTGISSRSDLVLTEQKANTHENLQILDKMVRLSEELRDSLVSNELKEFGKIMHKGWDYKKSLANNMTNPVIDGYYDKAINAGALGGTILGSGGGGFLLFYCETEKQKEVRKALKDLKELNFQFEPQGSKIIYVSD
jgi:D-glycero-alpha-D-manno-heptose-7-phosphate kinase